MTWVQGLLDDEEVFPARIGESELGALPASLFRPPFASFYCCLRALSSACRSRSQHPLTYGFFTTLSLGTPFPKNFRQTCQTVLRRLFRIYGHIYASHFDQICALGIEGASRFFRPMFNAISPTPS